ncbi:hypothetical protein [Peribacillus asahii]|uniref:hypothetical protein n=1 Tax=Peribacillus asahii TaxID=228899 RepID=UPI00207AA886|nr:hypothetical protein [Peribacillus asahii]USK61575.1 hypothetical protein LIT37_09775 [Peribacillus asahii]HWL23145.1 hypothetical protein [Ureibacillus sp.]
MKKWTTYDLALIALLASFIAITGAIKIPIGIPGSEFQLSAPIAVAIAAIFGFKRYLLAGILASLILFLLGIHNLLNIEIAMTFRIVAGGIVALFGTSLPVLILAGPIGTVVARFVLAFTLGVPSGPLLLAAIPGMIFTALTVWPLKEVFKKISEKQRRHHHVKRAL